MRRSSARSLRAAATSRIRSGPTAAPGRPQTSAAGGEPGRLHRQGPCVPLAHACPVVSPEEDSAERCGKVSAAHARTHADVVAAAIELRLDQDRPGIDPAQMSQCLIECGEGLLVTTARIADDVAITDRVVCQLAPQRQVDDVGVEPEAAIAVDAYLKVEGERDAVLQRVAD